MTDQALNEPCKTIKKTSCVKWYVNENTLALSAENYIYIPSRLFYVKCLDETRGNYFSDDISGNFSGPLNVTSTLSLRNEAGLQLISSTKYILKEM